MHIQPAASFCASTSEGLGQKETLTQAFSRGDNLSLQELLEVFSSSVSKETQHAVAIRFADQLKTSAFQEVDMSLELSLGTMKDI